MLSFTSQTARLPVPADGRSPGTFSFRCLKLSHVTTRLDLCSMFMYVYLFDFKDVLCSSPRLASGRLSNGVEMPAIGFGTWKLEGEAG